ncbi:MAG: zinc ribbon domain-containing protein [Firmicutes bacterium]|jgi:hypothetical protein|nr:zinc ribbon domain-containing protein [Bacillota bacterium]
MYCRHCGARLPPEYKFCPACGKETAARLDNPETGPTDVPVPPPPSRSDESVSAYEVQAQVNPTDDNLPGRIDWTISVPIFRNPLIMKQLGLAIGIPAALVVILLLFLTGRDIYTFYAMGLIVALLFFTWLFITLVYRGRYDAEFVLDGKGALCQTQSGQAQKNRIVNTLAVLFGFLSGKPATAGAGMLAAARQRVLLRWERLTKIKYYPRSHIILLRSGLMENIALFCTRDNYPMVEQFVLEKTKHLRTD